MENITQQRINAAERRYQQHFCFIEETPGASVMCDPFVPDIYMHNLTWLHGHWADDALRAYMERQLAAAKAQKRGHFHLVADEAVSPRLAEGLSPAALTDENIFFAMPASRLAPRPAAGVQVVRAATAQHFADAAVFDLASGAAELGEDFVRRRSIRKLPVFAHAPGLQLYLCYLGGRVIGRCEYFLDGPLVKFEDFDVLPTHQRKGYGSAMFTQMAADAVAEGAEAIYLVALQSGTAQQMYRKMGFEETARKTDFLFVWEAQP